MVRISPDFGALSLREIALFTLAGWGLFVPAAGVYLLLTYQARKLDEAELLRWQSNWERKRGYRRPLKEFATVFLKGAKRIRYASYMLGAFVLLGLIFPTVTLFKILATGSQHVLQDQGVITSLWAGAVLDFGVLLPASLYSNVISRALKSVGEKILLLANRLEADTSAQG